MVFKKSLAALVAALPLVLGMNLFFSKNVYVLNAIAASPSQVRSTDTACSFLNPIKTDLLDNFFENECGDAVRLLSPYYERLAYDPKGSWCSASRFP